MTTDPTITPDPDRDGVILHLPQITHLDTQVWAADVGLTTEGLAALRTALGVPAGRAASDVRDQLLHALDFAYVTGVLGYSTPEELLAAYDASRSPADRAALHRIAEAALSAVEAALGDTLVPAARVEALAGIVAVLPPPADRAAVYTSEDRCAECGHFRGVHEDPDEPVSVGRCIVCADDDAWHNYEPTAEMQRLTPDLAAADDPTPPRWGLDGILHGDDDTTTILLSGPDGAPYWLELEPERAAALREALAEPADRAAVTPPPVLTEEGRLRARVQVLEEDAERNQGLAKVGARCMREGHQGLIESGRATVEGHRFALSVALGLGTGAPWDAIHERVAELRRMADETPAAEAQPRRGDAFEQWLKAQRDEHRDTGRGVWTTLDNLLDTYRLHADMGVPLDGHVCEARVVGDCECLEQPAAGARQDAAATDEPAPGSAEPRPCRTFVSGGTVWCCEEGETDCPCVCHQPAATARQDGAQ